MNPFTLFRQSEPVRDFGTLSRRLSEKLTSRKYDGAARGKRLQKWLVTGNDADAELKDALSLLRNRARDLRRNNPYANRIVSAISNNIIGTGILPGCADLGYLEQFNAWANSTQCDFNGRLNLVGLQQLVTDTLIESGECLILKRWNKKNIIPLQLLVLEPDYLDHTKESATIIQGVERDSKGLLKGYWLFSNHPGSTTASSTTSSFVSADNVIHVFRQDRAGQNRGIPWLSPVMILLKKLAEYQDAMVDRLAISNLVAAFVSDLNGEQDTTTPADMEWTPGTVIHLPPGKDIKFNTPPDPGDPNVYISSVLHAISAGVGVTYELLTNDFSQTNFSSSRMGGIEFGRSVDSWRFNLIIPQFLDNVAQWYHESTLSSSEPPVITWVPPRRQMLDPIREIPPIIESIRSGLITPSAAVREQGYDFVEFIKEYASDMKLLSDLGIVLSSDCRQDSARLKTIYDMNAANSQSTQAQAQ